MPGGAGILIIESYKGIPVITLFGKDNMNYSDIGGRSDPGETSEITAYREGREETANMINITPEELTQYAAHINFKGYIAYIIYIDGISFKDYIHNVNMIHSNCSWNEKHWMETNSMVRIPLNNILMSANNHTDYATDINGYVVPIRGRTMGIVRMGSTIINSMVMMQPIKMHKHLVSTSRLPCLIGTYTYTITQAAIYSKSPTQFGLQDGNYAVYIAPNLTSSSHPFLKKCNPTWGGIHVTIVGFHPDNINAKKFIKYISSQSSNNAEWTVSLDKIKTTGNTIYFKSRTLDKLADFLQQNGFHKIKGKKYSNSDWHITSECQIPSIKEIQKMLKYQTWSLVLIKEKNNKIKWLNRYPLYVL
ncbi:NUDIX hydrolase [Indivirus ILV1]|uniref:NUDIX hydrolase n=1 Tax=Indivirus ILV1 TaxID=1977633 RepID=A0A1V0SDC4_9VIRU|nr:NUDIX hydrolase [Indivirus ILV1]